MTEEAFYTVWDSVRDRMPHEFVALSEPAAISEFCSWYNLMVPVSRWEKRRLPRFYLVKGGLVIDGVKRRFVRPVIIFEDWEVELDEFRFRMSDPPISPAEEAEDAAEYKRLCAVDAARRARMSQLKLRRRVEDEVIAA